MTGSLHRTFLAALVSLGFTGQAEVSAVTEPMDYRRDDYRSPTPQSLRGANVLTTNEAGALWKDGVAIFIDVMPQPKRPENLPAGTLWRLPPRQSIPGAVWLPNVGYGTLTPETEHYFIKRIERATNGDCARPIVFFCLRDCWMSWNAAKRVLTYGYTAVYWYPDGTDGWGEAGLPLQAVHPAP